jgi:hypothetical protein
MYSKNKVVQELVVDAEQQQGQVIVTTDGRLQYS